MNFASSVGTLRKKLLSSMQRNRIDSWECALEANRLVPTDDIVRTVNECIAYSRVSSGDRVPWELEPEFSSFFAFTRSQRTMCDMAANKYLRSTSICLIQNRKENDFLLPRWTFPFCYFGRRYCNCFYGKTGLDAGCIVNEKDTTIEKQFDDNDPFSYFHETYVPHFQYYSDFGCNMSAIDLQLIDTDANGRSHGDLRSLEADDQTIDFITVPMIMGPGNPMNTFLDLTLCLSQMLRVLKLDGLIYIADFTINTSFLLAIWLCGFRVFYNENMQCDLPIGLFLVPSGQLVEQNQFYPVLADLYGNELIPCGWPQTIINRDLLLGLSL